MVKEKKKKQFDFGAELVCRSAEETKELGREIGNEIRNKRQVISKKTIVLALSGNLGSGKTTFVQGLAEGLGIGQRIISPTFVIVRAYRIKLKTEYLKLKTFYHVDLYRLEENVEGEFENLGMGEVLSNPENVIAIEWADKARDLLPGGTMWIRFENLGGEKRRIKVDQVN